MTVKPIPQELLRDAVTLLVPAASGYESCELSCVRVVRKSAVSDRSAVNVRDVSEITVYYDCVNSSPAGAELSAGMLLESDGVRYEIIRAEEFSALEPHHIRITARRV